MWTAGMHGYSRFSHQLNFQLTKAGFPPLLWAPYAFGCSVWLYSCVQSVAELKLLSDLGLLFPGRRRGVTGAGVVTAMSLNSLWTRESLCSVSSEHEWDLYTSGCTREALGMLSLLLFRLSYWRRILTLAPMLTPPCLSICIPVSWAGQLPQGPHPG